ncbi:MAG: AAA family ATPase [Verrucomicrobiota bacterium]
MNSHQLKELAHAASEAETMRQEEGRIKNPPVGLSGEFDAWMRLPLTRALTQGYWHKWIVYSPIKIAQLLDEFSDSLVGSRSYDDYDEDDPESEVIVWSYLKIDPDCWVAAGQSQLEVYARDRETARDVAQGLWFLFRKQAEMRPPEYHIVKQSGGDIESENIILKAPSHGGVADWNLFYGDDFTRWHSNLATALTERHNGITLFEGPPGTGKTSYIRHLMYELKDTHRFYFLPSSNLRVLKNAEFVDFWSSERRQHPDRQMIIILEDSEEALFPRTNSNSAEVGVLLNITDGLLGDFLRLHIICTVNCKADLLDPALLRPGRLVSRRYFGRLSRAQAFKVAQKLNKPLPPGDDFSLAEIVNGKHTDEHTISAASRKVGFCP